MNDDARPGRPSTSTTHENTTAVKKIVMENRRNTIREVAEDVGITDRLMPCNFSGYFGSEACGSEFRSKIAKF